MCNLFVLERSGGLTIKMNPMFSDVPVGETVDYSEADCVSQFFGDCFHP